VVMLPRPGIAVWSFATGRSEFTFETGSVRPDVIGFCSNDQFMVMGTPAGSGPRSMLQVMDVRTRKPLRNWQGNFTRDQVALSRDGKTLALPTEVNNVRQIQIWDATL